MKKSKVKELIKESVGGESIRTEDEYGSIFFKLPNGKLHRENGPTCECNNGYKAWYINDVEYKVKMRSKNYLNY